FRPSAVRAYLGNKNVNFTETRSKPFVVIPVAYSQGKPVVWEQQNAWRAAWAKAAHGGGLIPLIVPQGTAEDTALLSSADALNGDSDAIKSIIEKYSAGGAIIVTLETDPAL